MYMNRIKNVVVLSAAIFSSSLTYAGSDQSALDTHYMMNGGKGPQGRMMQGAEHNSSGISSRTLKSQVNAQEPATHYMMGNGRGPQGYLMAGVSHNGGAAGNTGKINGPEGKHYMMLFDDGPHGYWMAGNSHS